MRSTLLFFLPILAIIASCGGQTQNPVTDTQTTTTETPSTSLYQWLVDAAPKGITETDEFFACVESSVHSCVQNVALQVATQNNDVSFCAHLENDEQKIACEFGVITSHMIGAQNADACSQLSDEKYQSECKAIFITGQAVASENAELCKNIVVEDETYTRRDQCIMSVVQSLSTIENTNICSQLHARDLQITCESLRTIQREVPPVTEMFVETNEWDDLDMTMDESITPIEAEIMGEIPPQDTPLAQ